MAFGRRLLLLLGLFAFEVGQASDKPFVLMKNQNPRIGSKKTSYKKPSTFASNISNSTMSPFVNYCGFGVIGLTKEAVVNVSIPQTGKSNTKVLSITSDSPTLSTVFYKINAVNGSALMNPSGGPTNASSSPETNDGPRSVNLSTPENGNPENESSSKSCKMEDRIPELIVSVSVGTQPNQTKVYAVNLTDQLLMLTIEISTGFSVKPRLCASPNHSASVFIEFVSINAKNTEVSFGSWGYGQTATEASISVYACESLITTTIPSTSIVWATSTARTSLITKTREQPSTGKTATVSSGKTGRQPYSPTTSTSSTVGETARSTFSSWVVTSSETSCQPPPTPSTGNDSCIETKTRPTSAGTTLKSIGTIRTYDAMAHTLLILLPLVLHR